MARCPRFLSIYFSSLNLNRFGTQNYGSILGVACALIAVIGLLQVRSSHSLPAFLILYFALVPNVGHNCRQAQIQLHVHQRIFCHRFSVVDFGTNLHVDKRKTKESRSLQPVNRRYIHKLVLKMLAHYLLSHTS